MRRRIPLISQPQANPVQFHPDVSEPYVMLIPTQPRRAELHEEDR
jgi:hypothetical protein